MWQRADAPISETVDNVSYDYWKPKYLLMETVLQYVPFSSMVEPGFWHKLSENKLNVYGLDDKPRQIKGFYFNGNDNT